MSGRKIFLCLTYVTAYAEHEKRDKNWSFSFFRTFIGNFQLSQFFDFFQDFSKIIES
jgi:hypothetical protein